MALLCAFLLAALCFYLVVRKKIEAEQ